MCELCGEDKQKGRDRAHSIASELTDLARLYREVASGSRKPHTNDMLIVDIKAKYVIKQLVEDWV